MTWLRPATDTLSVTGRRVRFRPAAVVTGEHAALVAEADARHRDVRR